MKVPVTEADCERTFNYLVQDIANWHEKEWLKAAIISHLRRLLNLAGYRISRDAAEAYVERRFKNS